MLNGTDAPSRAQIQNVCKSNVSVFNRNARAISVSNSSNSRFFFCFSENPKGLTSRNLIFWVHYYYYHYCFKECWNILTPCIAAELGLGGFLRSLYKRHHLSTSLGMTLARHRHLEDFCSYDTFYFVLLFLDICLFKLSAACERKGPNDCSDLKCTRPGVISTLRRTGSAQTGWGARVQGREGRGGWDHWDVRWKEKGRPDCSDCIFGNWARGDFADLLTGVFSAPRKTPPETESRSLFKSQVSLKFIPPALAPRNLWLRPDE